MTRRRCGAIESAMIKTPPPLPKPLQSLANVKADETMLGHFFDWLGQEEGEPGKATSAEIMAALAQGGEGAFPGKGNPPALEEELRRLRAEVKRLTMERDVLKKATAFFARESS